jgi:dihydroorotase
VIDPVAGVNAIEDVFVADGVIVARPATTDGFERVDCTGKVVSPAFVDLHACMPNVVTEAAAAVAGGFGTVLLSPANPAPIDRPAMVRDLRAHAMAARCDIEVAGALTVGLAGEELADLGLLVEAGCGALSNGTTPVRNARVLRHVLEYAGRCARLVLLRAGDVDLEGGGVVREGPRAAWLGLPYVPPEAEEIGVTAVAALVRRTGTPVHLTHVWSARGVAALRRAKADGLPLSGSTTVHHLAVSDAIIDQWAYAGVCRFVPPLGDEADRAALLEALVDGTLSGVATDHRPVPLHLQDRELELAAPGAVAFETALPLVLGVVHGDLTLAVRFLSVEPARILGRIATLRPGTPARVVVFDPADEWIVDPETLLSSERNTPLLGQRLRGRVRWAVLKADCE